MKPIKYIVLALSVILLLSTVVSAEKFQRGTIFVLTGQDGKENYYIVSAYIPSTDSYELTSPTEVTTVQRSIVDTWTPRELETWYEKIVRGLNVGAIIGGIIMPEIYGDIDGNNVIEKQDAVLATSAYFGSSGLNQYQLNAADVSPMRGDGKVDQQDAVKIVAYYLSFGEPQPDSRIGVLIPNPISTPSAVATVLPAPTTVITAPSTTGTMTINSNPQGAAVYLMRTDGVNYVSGEMTTPFTMQVSTGYYTLFLKKSGYNDWHSETRQVLNGQATSVSATMIAATTVTPAPTPLIAVTPVPPAPTPLIAVTPGQSSGIILVWSYPDGASVSVNDVEKGTTDGSQWLQLVTSPGTYTVKVAKSGYQTHTQQNVVIGTGGQTSVQAILTATTPASIPAATTSLPTIPYGQPQTPGFEAIIAIIGLLIVAYIVLKNEKKDR